MTTRIKDKKPTKAEMKAYAAYLSSLGASKGGKARAAKLSPERRREIARGAIKARWDKKRREERGSSAKE
jgi:hypothetical protein